MATQTRGRPRSFDRDAALERAVQLFWEHGYEATSISDLTAAMGIRAPSLYAAFGDKAALFNAAIEAYAQRYGGFIPRALAEEPTAKSAVERVLHEAATEYTMPDRPGGCMVICAGVNTTSTEVRDRLTAMRNANVAAFADRIAADVAAGLLPAHIDAAALARYIGVVLQGMSQSARDGATRPELERTARLAMQAWP